VATTDAGTGVHCDPYDTAIDDDPYPTWRRLRDEMPLTLPRHALRPGPG
jgi:hypothetical protein